MSTVVAKMFYRDSNKCNVKRKEMLCLMKQVFKEGTSLFR